MAVIDLMKHPRFASRKRPDHAELADELRRAASGLKDAQKSLDAVADVFEDISDSCTVHIGHLQDSAAMIEQMRRLSKIAESDPDRAMALRDSLFLENQLAAQARDGLRAFAPRRNDRTNSETHDGGCEP